MTTKDNEASKEREWRFYRSNLSTIVWDPNRNRPLADFSEGHFTTSDVAVANKLLAMGYMEIPLDSEQPPMGVILRQPAMQIEGDVPVMSPAIGERIAEERMKARMRQVSSSDDGPSPIVRVVQNVGSNLQPTKPQPAELVEPVKAAATAPTRKRKTTSAPKAKKRSLVRRSK